MTIGGSFIPRARARAVGRPRARSAQREVRARVQALKAMQLYVRARGLAGRRGSLQPTAYKHCAHFRNCTREANRCWGVCAPHAYTYMHRPSMGSARDGSRGFAVPSLLYRSRLGIAPS